MNKVTSIEILPASKQEVLPDSFASFPHITSRAEINRYSDNYVPWHWHRAMELFYIESGELEYNVPKARFVFPAGSGGLVNSGVLHMTRPLAENAATISLLHLFEPELISGDPNGRIAEKYVRPLLESNFEIIPLYPDSADGLLKLVRASLDLDEERHGYELRLRAQLSEIWLQISGKALSTTPNVNSSAHNNQLKRMMVYIQEHYAERICVSELASASFSSKRECYRLFHDYLHCSPMEYITSYRLQKACELLRQNNESITAVAQACGFSTSSHFGKVFAENFGTTPRQFRKHWQDHDKNSHK